MTNPDDLDRSDMERLAKGHDDALNSLIERHSKKLFHYLIRQLQNEQDAEDTETENALEDRLPSESPMPDRQLQESETAEAVRRAIAALPEELRTALILSEYESLSHSEIAAILNCTSKAVETRLYRARKILRERLPHDVIS